MRKDLIWPATLVITAVITGLVVLSLMDKDTQSLATFAGVALAALIYERVGAVKSLVNGNVSKLVSLLEKQGDQLANSTPLDGKPLG